MSALVSVLRLFYQSPLWICLRISLASLPGIFDFQDLLYKLFCRSALWTQSKNPAQAGFFDCKNVLSVSHLSRYSPCRSNYILLVTSTRESGPDTPDTPDTPGAGGRHFAQVTYHQKPHSAGTFSTGVKVFKTIVPLVYIPSG